MFGREQGKKSLTLKVEIEGRGTSSGGGILSGKRGEKRRYRELGRRSRLASSSKKARGVESRGDHLERA